MRNGLNYRFSEASAILYTAALVASAVVAAASVAGERARGTWTSLLSTPLDRTAILKAKMRGAVRGVFVPLGMILFLDLLALASTAMHPIGFVLGLASVASFLWLAVALGTYLSLRSNDAAQAITRTVLVLLAINLIPVFVGFPVLSRAALFLGGCTPYLLMELSMSPMRVATLGELGRLAPFGLAAFVSWSLGLVAAHALAAWFLTRAALRRVASISAFREDPLANRRPRRSNGRRAFPTDSP